MSKPSKSSSTLLQYYKDELFNPVFIGVEDEKVWLEHVAKRRMLYQMHLMLPEALFNRASILEFGCNSGENALYLASLGGRLTLVEPNEQVLDRLNNLFKDRGLKDRISALHNNDVEGFKSQEKYDVVLAEGFLNCLSNRAHMLEKLCGLVRPKGVGVVSFDDVHGSFLETIKLLLLKRCSELEGINDLQKSLPVAQKLFEEDFKRLNASRSFEAWWKDVLVNPFFAFEYLWTYREVIAILENNGCEILSTSPSWSQIDKFSWYKNTRSSENRHKQFFEDWLCYFAYLLTGITVNASHIAPAAIGVTEDVSGLCKLISDYAFGNKGKIEEIIYPRGLQQYFNASTHPQLKALNEELIKVFSSLSSTNAQDIIHVYRQTKSLRSLWGTPCVYVSFEKIK